MDLFNGKIFTKENKKKFTSVDTIEIKELTLPQIIKLLENLEKSEKSIYTLQIYLIDSSKNSIIDTEKVV